MLAVAADSWIAGCVFLDVLGACSCSPSPATSAIRTTNRKYQVRTPYSAWRCKQAPRSAMPSVGSDIFSSPVLLSIGVNLLRSSSCWSFSTVLRCSAYEPLQIFVSVACFRVSRLFHVVGSVLGDIPVVACIGEQV